MEGALQDWRQVYRRAFEAIAPGGSVHVVSQDLWTYRDGGKVPDSIQSWMEELNQLMETLGHPTRIAKKHRGWIEEAGFEDVDEVELLIPMGWWAKDPKLKRAGTFYLASVLEGIKSYSIKPLFDHAGWKVDEVAVLRANVDKAYRDMSLNLYSKVFVVTGRKPGTAGI
jgi:hypothetical protein